MWIDRGRPHSGVVVEIIRRTRAAYHYAIRRAKKNETEIVRERFADMILQNKSRDFWSEVLSGSKDRMHNIKMQM